MRSVYKNSVTRHWLTVKQALALTVIVAVTAAPVRLAAAAEVVYTPQYNRCMDASGSTTVGMVDCMSAEAEIWDTQLNANYKKLMASLQPDRQTALKGAQRAWIKFRDANCDFAYDPNGGSMARLSANDCFLRMTAERAEELASFIQEY